MQPTENQPQILLIAQTLRDTYAGAPWHGSGVKEILRGVTPQQASSWPLPEAHSIWELVLHMTVWRQSAWNKLTGNHAFERRRIYVRPQLPGSQIISLGEYR